MNNYKFCQIHRCDYNKYYSIQAGGSFDPNEISFYTGKPYQRGYGIFSTFGTKYALPFFRYFGRKAMKFGKNVLTDVLNGEETKSVLKSNLKRSANETIDDIKDKLNQKGKRRKLIRKRVNKKKIKKKSKHKKKQATKKKVRKKKSKKKIVRKKSKRKKNSKTVFDF